MTTYYVDGTNGNDANDGLTVATAKASVINAAIFKTAGNVIRLKRGTRIRLNAVASLPLSASITYEAYYNSDGSDDVTQPRPILYGTTSAEAMYSTSATGTVTLRNIEFDGQGLVTSVAGFTCRRGARAEISNCYFHHCAGGIYFGAGNGGIIENCTIDYMTTSGGGGLYGGEPSVACASNWIIRNNYIDARAKGALLGAQDAIVFHEGTGIGTGNSITGNTIYTGTENAIDILDTADGGVYVNTIITNNRIYGNSRGLSPLIVTDDASANTTIVGNYIENGPSCLYLKAPGAIVRSNVIYNDQANSNAACIYLATATCTGIIIENNTLVGGSNIDRGMVVVANAAATYTFKNNIVINYSSDQKFSSVANGATVTYANNLWYSPTYTTSTLAFTETGSNVTWTAFSGNTAGSSFGVNPLLTSNYQPTLSSPGISAGVHLGYYRDEIGNFFYNLPSIGAYEYIRPRGTRT